MLFFELLPCVCNQSLVNWCIVEEVYRSQFVDGSKFQIIALKSGIQVSLCELGGKT
jgi:hypothetical protein